MSITGGVCSSVGLHESDSYVSQVHNPVVPMHLCCNGKSDEETGPFNYKLVSIFRPFPHSLCKNFLQSWFGPKSFICIAMSSETCGGSHSFVKMRKM